MNLANVNLPFTTVLAFINVISSCVKDGNNILTIPFLYAYVSTLLKVTQKYIMRLFIVTVNFMSNIGKNGKH